MHMGRMYIIIIDIANAEAFIDVTPFLLDCRHYKPCKVRCQRANVISAIYTDRYYLYSAFVRKYKNAPISFTNRCVGVVI